MRKCVTLLLWFGSNSRVFRQFNKIYLSVLTNLQRFNDFLIGISPDTLSGFFPIPLYRDFSRYPIGFFPYNILSGFFPIPPRDFSLIPLSGKILLISREKPFAFWTSKHHICSGHLLKLKTINDTYSKKMKDENLKLWRCFAVSHLQI